MPPPRPLLAGDILVLVTPLRFQAWLPAGPPEALCPARSFPCRRWSRSHPCAPWWAGQGLLRMEVL